MGLDFRVGYSLLNRYNAVGSSAVFTGSGFVVGVGYPLLSFIKLNFDYKMFNYDKYKSFSYETELTGDYIIKNKEAFISLSFPIRF